MPPIFNAITCINKYICCVNIQGIVSVNVNTCVGAVRTKSLIFTKAAG